MSDDVETLQKMVRWLAERVTSYEEATSMFPWTDRTREKTIDGWVHEARRGVADG